VKISFDPPKREWTLKERGLDFADAAEVFAGIHTVEPDDRHDYGKARFISAGLLHGRVVVCHAQNQFGAERQDRLLVTATLGSGEPRQASRQVRRSRSSGATRPQQRSGPKPSLTGAALRKAVMATWCVWFCGMQCGECRSSIRHLLYNPTSICSATSGSFSLQTDSQPAKAR
jgi:uncharacterized DUF497 family protein